MEIVGGIVAIVVGVIMLIIGGAVLNAVTVGDGIGNCDSQDYDGKNDGHTQADKETAAYKQCNATKNNAFTVLNIMSVMFIIGGVIITIRGIGMGPA